MEWLSPAGRKSLQLFQTYKTNTPAGIIPNGSTVQGLYCMTADGEHLSGAFARTSRDRAAQVIKRGWNRFEVLARTRGWKPRPVPRTPLDFTGGKPIQRGGMKLKVAVRDLPRGTTTRPGHSEQERCAHNLNWLDLTPRDAAAFVTTQTERRPVSVTVLRKIAFKALKDCVRGQCSDWKRGALRDGRLYTKRIGKSGNVLTMRISGYAILSQNGRSYACQLHGRAVYDTRHKTFQRFDLAAAGQRAGRDQFNFRTQDPGPAPMGVAIQLHREAAK